ncbi:terminase [Burkholderia sp. GbtcB21]|uniref:phage terminase large subunit family protein n=1 Tax=Burkholderia sp. GbtcB21 TaxID=2824766 RepID=UPI001C3056CB|nr:terminase [Burkholderia sp. GbtcB21]
MTRHVVRATIDDAVPYVYSRAQADAIIAGYPAHERDARAKGIPILGSGRVFPISDDDITVDAFPIPRHWKRIGGLDFGWDHPTAATKLVHDADEDVIYVTSEYKVREQTPLIHAGALRHWDGHVCLPWAWPHDGLQHDKGSGEQLAEKYCEHGLDMLAERATFEDGSNGVEAGVTDMLERMQTGRWKVFKHLSGWLDEFRLYHRKNGVIVKEFDDLISSSRYALMMLRFAKPDIPPPSQRRRHTGSWMSA